MSDREEDAGRPSDETQAFSEPPEPPPPPPSATQPLPVDPPPPPPRNRRILIGALLLLVVLGLAFIGARLLGGKSDNELPGKNVVFFEPASMVFPVEGAKFTRSTYDPKTQKCDPALLKRYLRADPRRFKAWLELVNIREDQFDAFVDQLETRILPAPLAVTNHGCFREGEGKCWFAVQSVLAAGTPVWYNPFSHEVIAKCLCSNPIDPPACPPNCGDGTTPLPCPCASPSPTPFETRPPRTETPQDTVPPPTESATFTEAPKTESPPTEPPRTEQP